MAYAFTFEPTTTMTADQYDEVIKRLDAAGEGTPEGRLHHVAFGAREDLRVIDIWDSMESFDRFGATLLPILASLGVDAGQPQVAEVHNIIRG